MTDSDKDTYRIVIGLVFGVQVYGLGLGCTLSELRMMSVGCVRV